MDRMEEDYEKFAARLAPHLKDPPSKFFKAGNIFFTLEVEERLAPYSRLVHPDVIMWASDFSRERELDQFGGDLPHLMARKPVRAVQAQDALRQSGQVLSVQRGRSGGGQKSQRQLDCIKQC
jgi:hypothetical protein